MPQMAPSSWLIIYLFMNMMIILISSNLFFFPQSKLTLKKAPSPNSIMSLMWQ
uniref:ATP synthase F0 subunit 8 n=1 Tax=Metacrangonyx remyi TaxID=931576 RepID=K7ZWM4_9CRUS|nr:ATP synthase F0 subunit 8 [Metacrangonyx remyi]CCI69562.1 ATP synthase F0 subunit 8 [Metacrangonyx remyi]